MKTSSPLTVLVLLLSSLMCMAPGAHAATPADEAETSVASASLSCGETLIRKLYSEESEAFFRDKFLAAWRRILDEHPRTTNVVVVSIFSIGISPPERSFVLSRLGKPDSTRDEAIPEWKVVATGTVISKTFHWYGPFGVAFGSDDPKSVLVAIAYTPNDAWLRIISDEDFKGIWANAEIAYQVAVQSGLLVSGADKDLLGFEDMMKFFRNPPLTVEALTKKYGKPFRLVEHDGHTWLDYGPIQFAKSKDGNTVASFQAQRGFFHYGFQKVVENTLKHHEKAEAKAK